jgi:predicted transcriptional regulator
MHKDDIEIILSAESDTTEKFPLDLIEKIASGENPIKAYRQYRKLSQVALAKKVKVSKQYISQLELGEKKAA